MAGRIAIVRFPQVASRCRTGVLASPKRSESRSGAGHNTSHVLSRQAEARRVRQPRAFNSAAIPSSVQRFACRSRIAASTVRSCGSGSRCSPSGPRPETVCNIPDTLAIGFLVAHRVARALTNGLTLPLLDRRHDINHQPASRRSGVERLGHRDERHPASSASTWPDSFSNDPLCSAKRIRRIMCHVDFWLTPRARLNS